MARVTAYQATDKQLFLERRDYILHQSNLNAIEDIRKLVQTSGSGKNDLVETFFTENILTLREILSRKFNPSEKSDSARDDAPEGSTESPAEAEVAPVATDI